MPCLNVGVACNTSGQETEDGWTVIMGRIFTSATEMMEFLGIAMRIMRMRSIAPDVLRMNSECEIELPISLPKPKRRWLPIP